MQWKEHFLAGIERLRYGRNGETDRLDGANLEEADDQPSLKIWIRRTSRCFFPSMVFPRSIL